MFSKKEKKEEKLLTVGEVKEIIKDLPDEAEVYVTCYTRFGTGYRRASAENVFIGDDTKNLYLTNENMYATIQYDIREKTTRVNEDNNESDNETSDKIADDKYYLRSMICAFLIGIPLTIISYFVDNIDFGASVNFGGMLRIFGIIANLFGIIFTVMYVKYLGTQKNDIEGE